MAESTGLPESVEPTVTGNPPILEGRRGPTWRGWVLSILVAIALSVTATLLLGGSAAFRSDRAAVAAAGGSGTGSNCCPPANAGK